MQAAAAHKAPGLQGECNEHEVHCNRIEIVHATSPHEGAGLQLHQILPNLARQLRREGGEIGVALAGENGGEDATEGVRFGRRLGRLQVLREAVHLLDELRWRVRLTREGNEFEQIIDGYALRFIFAFLLCRCLVCCHAALTWRGFAG